MKAINYLYRIGTMIFDRSAVFIMLIGSDHLELGTGFVSYF